MIIEGYWVVKSPMLPLSPSDAEVARRIVRNGYAKAFTDFESWAGPVGPKPEEKTHVILGVDPASPADYENMTAFVSAEAYEKLREERGV